MISFLTLKTLKTEEKPTLLSPCKGHGVHHQQNIIGSDDGFHPPQLVHQSLVHMEPSGGIQKHQVVSVISGVFQGVFCDFDRVALPFIVYGEAQLPAHDL